MIHTNQAMIRTEKQIEFFFFPSHLPLLKDAANEVPADRLCEKRSGLAPLGLRSATFGAFGELVWCSLVFRFGENKVWFVLI